MPFRRIFGSKTFKTHFVLEVSGIVSVLGVLVSEVVTEFLPSSLLTNFAGLRAKLLPSQKVWQTWLDGIARERDRRWAWSTRSWELAKAHVHWQPKSEKVVPFNYVRTSSYLEFIRFLHSVELLVSANYYICQFQHSHVSCKITHRIARRIIIML